MNRSRRILVSLAGVALLALGGSAAVYARITGAASTEEGEPRRQAGTVRGSAASGFAADVPIPVRGEAVRREALVMSVGAAGQAEAWQKTVVAAQVGGRIATLQVRESDAVGAGQAVLALDPAEFGLAVEEARAGVRDAQAKYQELTIFDDQIADAGTRADRARIARSKSGLETAEVRLRRAQLDLSRTRMAAPFGGRIATLQVVPGQWVRAGDELMTVVNLDPIKVEVQVLESEVGHLAPGRRAAVSFAAFAGEAFSGRVETINPMVDGQTRTARVTVLVPNPGGRILPGMYARVSLEARRFEDRVLVPRGAILERDRRTMLFVFEGPSERGTAKWRYVTTGLQNDSLVEIVKNPDTEMVSPGERVLTDGHHTLIHDARVRMVGDVAGAGGRPN
jgi:RND family efflux transporter MFP subunit